MHWALQRGQAKVPSDKVEPRFLGRRGRGRRRRKGCGVREEDLPAEAAPDAAWGHLCFLLLKRVMGSSLVA